jgi:hypothetical protein
MDAGVRLQELRPADPGERSGCWLVVCEGGEHILMGAYFGAHNLGSLQASDVAAFSSQVSAARRAHRGTANAQLREIHAPYRFAGMKLEYFHGSQPEMRVTGESGHCFGVTRGLELEALLDTISFRLGAGAL